MLEDLLQLEKSRNIMNSIYKCYCMTGVKFTKYTVIRMHAI